MKKNWGIQAAMYDGIKKFEHLSFIKLNITLKKIEVNIQKCTQPSLMKLNAIFENAQPNWMKFISNKILLFWDFKQQSSKKTNVIKVHTANFDEIECEY